MTLLTVGLPVYNAIRYLPETVDSLLKQSCREFELLVIDDGSTDGSGEYVDSLAGPGVRVIHQENRGITATLNRMLEEVRTPWLVRQDADDVAYPDRIKMIVEYTGRYPEAGMFYSLADYYPKGASVGTFRSTIAGPEALRDLTRAGHLLAICHPTVCLNVDKTLRLGGYRFDLHVEDVDLWWRMALNHDIVLIPEKLLGLRINAGSVSQLNLERQTLNTLYVQYLLLSHLSGREPQPYERAAPALDAILDRKQLRFREHIRRTNMAVAGGDWAGAIGSGVHALAASPMSFLRRFAYEFSRDKAAVNGADPGLFERHREELWPGGVR